MRELQTANVRSTTSRGAVLSACTIAFALAMLIPHSASAQTYSVIHEFTGWLGGANPDAGVVMDRAGNLYGTTLSGGLVTCGDVPQLPDWCGTVFELTAGGQFRILYRFANSTDGANPEGELLIAPNGVLYGTTMSGGLGRYGTIFSLAPPATPPRDIQEAQWTKKIVYGFAGNNDGAIPNGPLVPDHAGNLYGTTNAGGSGGNYGTVFELIPADGRWNESILHRFEYSDGDGPDDGVTFDAAGNLYGTTQGGGRFGSGVVYQLLAASGWQDNTLNDFQQGGSSPESGVTFDPAGNLFAATFGGGSGGAGTVFELSNGSWTPQTIYNFSGGKQWGPSFSKLILDPAGNFYGTTNGDGAYGAGSVFKLTLSDGGWTYTSLHDFTGGSDGGYPVGTLLLDANGNLYGTTSGGGQNSNGVVFKITP